MVDDNALLVLRKRYLIKYVASGPASFVKVLMWQLSSFKDHQSPSRHYRCFGIQHLPRSIQIGSQGGHCFRDKSRDFQILSCSAHHRPGALD
jgi:hypothetical protein